MKACLALFGVMLSALCSSVCRAEADPDADPDAEVRLSPGFDPEVGAGPDGAQALADVAAAAPLGCNGASAIAFTLDASNSVQPIEFAPMQAQVNPLDYLGFKP